tara:strand:- start:18 stop:422 length:405 start_codon:yes stop_codon:yes gene_type:complete
LEREKKFFNLISAEGMGPLNLLKIVRCILYRGFGLVFKPLYGCRRSRKKKKPMLLFLWAVCGITERFDGLLFPGLSKACVLHQRIPMPLNPRGLGGYANGRILITLRKQREDGEKLLLGLLRKKKFYLLENFCF